MKDKKIPNIQRESDRLKIKKSICDNEDKKSKILLEMGMKVYSKIRKGELVDLDLVDMCEEIKNIDIDIYTEYMKLRNLEENNKKIICDCGYTAYKNEKFCPQCGKNLMPKEKQYIICNNCETQNEVDSNYCGCCGHKMKSQFISSYNKDYIDEEAIYDVEDEKYDDVNSNQDILYNDKLEINKDYDDEYQEERVIEVEGRAFLKHQQSNNDNEV